MSKNDKAIFQSERAWDPLKIGDQIAVVNICMQDRQREVHADAYKKLFSDWGCKIDGYEQLKAERGYRLWSGTPEDRAKRVIDAIMNEDNKAICLLVGGDGANEVMKLVLKYHQEELAKGEAGRPLPKRGIPMIGLSNNTTLLNPLAQMGIISPVQGKLDAAIALGLDLNPSQKQIVIENALALKRFLFGEDSELSFPVAAINQAAIDYKGKDCPIEIVGGCNFHVIESARTSFQLETSGKFLVLEGPEEQCSVKETIDGLKREGMLDGVEAIFLGHISGFEKPEKKSEIEEVVRDMDIPVFVGLPWGHIKPGDKSDVYLPLNTEALFIVENKKPTLKVSAYRTLENLDQAYNRKLPVIISRAREVEGDLIITSMNTMLQDPEHPNLKDKNVILALTPKYGEPVSHLIDLSRGLAALLQKGSLEGIKSLTVDLSGLYDQEKRPLYSNLRGEAVIPPHLYGDITMLTAVPDMKTYENEVRGYLQDFSWQYLGGIPVGVGYDKIVEQIAEKTGISTAQLKDYYQKSDGTDRLDASALVQDFDNGKGVENIRLKITMHPIDYARSELSDAKRDLKIVLDKMHNIDERQEAEKKAAHPSVKKMQSKSNGGDYHGM